MAAIQRVEAAPPATTVQDDADLLAPPDSGWTIVSYFGSEQGLGVTVRTGDRVDGRWLETPSYAALRDDILDPLGRTREGLGRSVSAQQWERALDAALRDLHGAADRARRSHSSHATVPSGCSSSPTAPCTRSRSARCTDGDGRALIDRYQAVAVVPGVRLVADTLRGLAAHGADELLVLAAPDTAAPLTAAEAHEIAATWTGRAPCTPLVGRGANPGELFAAAPDARVLHLACHGAWEAERPRESGIRLAPDPAAPPLFGGDAGLVNPAAILTQLDLSACRVAILSACETGLSRVSLVDEPLSLPLLLLLAGSRFTIASLWQVRDDSTLLLMSRLHRLLRDGVPPADALAGAQRALRAMTSDEAVEHLEHARAALGAGDLEDTVRQGAETSLAKAVDQPAARHTLRAP